MGIHHGYRPSGNNPYVASGSSLPVGGYIAWYAADSWTGSQWTDKSGNGNHVTTIGGTISSTSVTGNGSSKAITTLQGSTSAYMSFPSGILPSTYTLFHVTRYTGGTRRRIFSSTSPNWLSGFWNGCTAVAYHNGWLTASSGDPYVNNWMYSCDQNSLYRANGTTYGTGGGGASCSLNLNTDNYGETSDWQVAEVIVYPSNLSSTDYLAVEAYLASKYGI